MEMPGMPGSETTGTGTTTVGRVTANCDTETAGIPGKAGREIGDRPPGKPLGKPPGKLLAGRLIDGTAGTATEDRDGKGIYGKAMDGIATDGGPIEGTMIGRLGRDGITTGGIATGIDGIARGSDGIAIRIDDTATGREGAAGRLGRPRDGNIGISGGMAIRVGRGEVGPIAEGVLRGTPRGGRIIF